MNMYFKSILKAIPEIHGNLKKVSIAQYKNTASLILTCHDDWKNIKSFFHNQNFVYVGTENLVYTAKVLQFIASSSLESVRCGTEDSVGCSNGTWCSVQQCVQNHACSEAT